MPYQKDLIFAILKGSYICHTKRVSSMPYQKDLIWAKPKGIICAIPKGLICSKPKGYHLCQSILISYQNTLLSINLVRTGLYFPPFLFIKNNRFLFIFFPTLDAFSPCWFHTKKPCYPLTVVIQPMFSMYMYRRLLKHHLSCYSCSRKQFYFLWPPCWRDASSMLLMHCVGWEAKPARQLG